MNMAAVCNLLFRAYNNNYYKLFMFALGVHHKMTVSSNLSVCKIHLVQIHMKTISVTF